MTTSQANYAMPVSEMEEMPYISFPDLFAPQTVRQAECPTVGASLSINNLPNYLDWLVADQRNLEIRDPAEPTFLVNGWREAAAKTRSLLTGYPGQISIHGPFQSLTLFAHDPLIAAVVADRLRCALYFAAEIGATQIVIHSPFTPFGNPNLPYAEAKQLQHEFEIAQNVLGGLLPLAQEIGCVFVIENIYDTNPQPLIELVSSFHSPCVRMSLDVGHAFLTQQVGGPSPDQWMRRAAPLLAHVHLHDSDGQADRHWAIGRGKISWRALFAELRRLGNLPRLILEMKQPDDIQRSAQWLARRGYSN